MSFLKLALKLDPAPDLLSATRYVVTAQPCGSSTRSPVGFPLNLGHTSLRLFEDLLPTSSWHCEATSRPLYSLGKFAVMYD
jgi:hypothetical protein